MALDALNERVQTDASDAQSVQVGIDIAGPGGVQATVEMSREGILSVERGLQETTTVPIFRMNTSEFGACIATGVKNSAGNWENADPMTAAELSEMLFSGLSVSTQREVAGTSPA